MNLTLHIHTQHIKFIHISSGGAVPGTTVETKSVDAQVPYIKYNNLCNA